jgi:uncharacterized protein (DUF849 family)
LNHEVIITCAITGGGDTVGKHPAIPVAPAQIASSAIEAAKAGAAVVHCHVRDPDTGKPARDPALFREVVDRIRSSDTDVVINLTGGMGGDWGPSDNDPMAAMPGSDMINPEQRLEHVTQLLPEICTIDCGSMNFGDGAMIFVNPPTYLRAMAKIAQRLGVKPEIEVFELGHLRFAKQMLAEGLLDAPPLFQICLGIPWGAPADSATMKTFVDQLPAGAAWAGFGISRDEMPMVAQAILYGGNVRVGLEDNLYISRGVYASNGTLVERAATIVEALGARVVTAQEARQKLKLTKRTR